MSGLDYARVRAAFDRCVGLAADDPVRVAELAALAPPERAELVELLAAHDGAAAVDDLTSRIAGAARAELPPPARSGRFGAWRVTGELGEGGMGVVLAAERDDGEFRQRAAIKLIRGFPSTGARDRLRRERQILAALEHPNIARLLDGGTTPDGEPYLVMEYVDGEPLPAWLARRPGLDARIRLFAALCGAVAYAHQRLVVHRDIKPGNVMVRADGTPVLLDFGIAKLIEADEAGERTHSRVMTPAYASPEQLRGEAVTTATDVFGLGLVLYVLLGGSVNRRSDPIAAISTGVGAASDAARASDDAVVRGFAAELRGDLDAIVRAATRLEPQRRYASVPLLQQDVEAWMGGRPVAARGGDAWYRFGKFVSRHRAMLALGAASLVAMVAFMVQLAVERDRARDAEAAAEQEAATTREVLAFVTGLFEELDPNRGGHAGITAFELLERGRDRIDDVRTTSPAARGMLLRTLGEIYRAGERAQPALELLDRSYAQLIEARAPESELAMVEIKIAEVWNLLGNGARAGEYIDRALARRALIDADPALEAKARMTAGVSLQMRGRSDDAVASFERARTLFAALGEAGREGLASVLHNRGWLAGALGDPAGALDWFAQAEQAKRELLGGDHPSTLNTRLSAVVMLSELGRYAEAERKLLEMLPDVEHRVGATSGYAGRIWNELGSARQDLGRYGDAAEAYRRALAILGPYDDAAPNALVVRVVNNLASLDEDRGDLAAAEAGYRQSLAWRERSQAADSPAVARARHNLARTLLRRGAHTEAAALLAAARAIRDAQLPSTAPDRLASHALAVELLLAVGDHTAAQQEARALATASAGAQLPPRPAAAVQRALARAAAARGDAAARRIASEAAHAALRAGLPADHPMVALAELDLADALLADDPARARALRVTARTVLDGALAPDSPDRERLTED